MKKIILFLSILLISFTLINTTFAEGYLKVNVGVDLSSILWSNVIQKMLGFSWAWCSPDLSTNNSYVCEIPKWIDWFLFVMAWLIGYITFIASIAWVLFIVINWILYSMWWADDSLKTKSKERIIKTLIWLVILLLSWVILHIIAPWVYN